jgi:SAM-dependent methyltransferase
MTAVDVPARPLAGTAAIVRFNWPKYLAVAVFLTAGSRSRALGLPGAVTVGLVAAGALGALWSVTSLTASWWVYDHARVYDRVPAGLGGLGDWAAVHAGFDDATAHAARITGRGPAAVVELAVHGRSSLRRARAGGDGPPVTAEPVRPGDLPLGSASLDTILVTFAAHEVRDRRDQRALFAELLRVLRPGGRLVITEHLRDGANLAVFGPGAFHFQTEATWVARAGEAGLVPLGDVTITPFVRRMVWRR